MAEFPAPEEGILLTHFIVSDDVERSRRFYTDVLGGETIRAGEPSYVALANSGELERPHPRPRTAPDRQRRMRNDGMLSPRARGAVARSTSCGSSS